VAEVFAAEDRGDVPALIALVHPHAMAAFKQRQLDYDAMFTPMRALEPPDSAPPAAKATVEASQRPRPTLLQAIFKVRDRAEFERLSPEQVLTRWFRQTTRARTQPSRAGGGLPKRTREIIGEVPEGDGTVHVVFREVWTPDSTPGVPGRREPLVRVISVGQTPAGWRVMLNGGLVYDESGGWAIGMVDDEQPR
jgi:hypothetical protein